LSGSFFKGNLTYAFRAWVDFLFRRRMPGLVLLHIAGLLFLALLAGFALDFSIPTEHGRFRFAFRTGDAPNELFIGVFAVAAMLTCVGLFLTWRDMSEQRRKRVIAIELRGLRDTSGSPLADAVPGHIAGRREQLLINLRQGLDGQLIKPAAAMQRIMSLPIEIAGRETGLDRTDISYVASGLAPVPLSFLAGVLLDDESAVTLMDWNRHKQCWAALDADDDGLRFSETGLSDLTSPCDEAVLAVSVSYGVDLAGAAGKFPQLPVVQLTLVGADTDAHWSEEKQAALAKQFLDTAIALSDRGVARIHLLLAAPNSVVIRFGRIYDKRNLPDLIVYQYEKGQAVRYPWGIRMPVQGRRDPELTD
jgi:hypothetical protein